MSLHTIIRNLLDDDFEIDDASDIPEDMRPEIISAWRDTAKFSEIAEAFYPPAVEEAEELFESIAWSTLRIAAGNETVFDGTVARYWWLQIKWMVDAAIMEVRAEHELTNECDGESGRCLATLDIAPDGEWVLEQDVRPLLAVLAAARDLMNYENTGGPDYPEWDAKYQALYLAVDRA